MTGIYNTRSQVQSIKQTLCALCAKRARNSPRRGALCALWVSLVAFAQESSFFFTTDSRTSSVAAAQLYAHRKIDYSLRVMDGQSGTCRFPDTMSLLAQHTEGEESLNYTALLHQRLIHVCRC
jgi:hypothetical protein